MVFIVGLWYSKRLRAADGMSFGNEVYEISFDTEDKQHIPLFGAKYHFKLEGVVDCPEFIVHFPLLEKYVSVSVWIKLKRNNNKKQWLCAKF